MFDDDESTNAVQCDTSRKNLNKKEIYTKIQNNELKINSKRGRSRVWDVFGSIVNDGGEELSDFVACRNCKHVLVYNSRSTSNLVKHKCYQCSKKDSDQIDVDSTTKSRVTAAVTQWIVKNGRPFSIVDDDNFHDVLKLYAEIGIQFGHSVNIRQSLPHSTTVARNITGLFEKCFARLQTDIISAKDVGLAFTCDMWSDPYQTKHFLALTAHFVINAKTQKRLLGFKCMEGEKATTFLLLNLTSVIGTEWGYPDMEKNEAFPAWGGLCDNGIRQSPIDLSMKGAFRSDYNQLKFENYENKQTGVSMINNGHTIQLYEFPKPMKIGGGPLTDNFVVEQLHFHWWSEHTINNIRYPLECHIVHRNLDYPNMTEAAKHKDGIAVVGILYHVSNEKNEAIEDILEYIDKVKKHETINKPTKMKEFTVAELLPKVDGYFTYAGSLTTPTCAESVTWLLLHKTFPVTLAQVEKFKEVEYSEGKYLVNNYRLVQQGHNRVVVAVTYDSSNDEHKEGSGAAGLQMSLGVLTTVMVLATLLH